MREVLIMATGCYTKTIQQMLLNRLLCVFSLFQYICMFVCVCWRCTAFRVEVQLDRLKQKQKTAVRRALFVDSQQPSLIRSLAVPNGARRCHETKIYLRVSLSLSLSDC